MSDKSSGLVVGLSLVAALGGLLFGYDTAVISGAVNAINHNFIAPRELSEGAANALSGAAISIALLGCVLGAALAGPISLMFGRKGGLLVAAVMFLICAVGSAYPEMGLGPIGGMGADALVPFMIYRVIAGIGVGIASMLSPLYIAEIAPPQSRGKLVTFQQVAIVGGMTLVYFVNWWIGSQGDDAWILSTGWRYMLLSGVVPAGLFFLFLLFVPDTPRWYVLRGHDEKAQKVLGRLNDEATAATTFTEIKATLVEKTAPLFAFGGLVIVVGLALSILQQTVGINAVLYFAPKMFENMGADTNAALFNTILVGVTMVVFTLVSLVTVDRWGRKPLLIVGAIIQAASMIVLGLIFASFATGVAAETVVMTPQAAMFALVAVIVYLAGFSLSWGPVVWVMLAEIFPNVIKSKAMAIAVAVQWIANYVVSSTFPMLDGNSQLNALFNHGFAYWVYAVFSVLAALFVWKYVPETKGKSLEAIQGLWRHVPGAQPSEKAV
jgi:SP family xylose:H+ symportor-like MFS transporter